MKRSVLGLLAACAVLLTGTSAARAQLFIPSGFENYVWTAASGSGTWQTGNWDYWYGADDSPTGIAGLYVQDLGLGAYGSFTAPGAFDGVLFNNSTGSAIAVGLAGDMGDSSGDASIQFIVDNGPFVYNLNGFTIGNHGFTFGDGLGNAASVNFNGPGSVLIASLTLGADGSSNNIWGGSNATITFTGGAAYTLNGPVTVGSADGSGGGNIFNANGASYVNDFTVNAGSGNQLNLTNGASVTGVIAVGAGSSLLIDASTVTQASNSNFFGSNYVLNMAGEGTIQNGSFYNVLGGLNVSGHLVLDNATLSQTLLVGAQSNSTTAQLISGLLELKNGATYVSGYDAASTFKGDPMTVTGTGAISLDGASSMTVDSLSLASGSSVQVNGGSTFTVAGAWDMSNNAGIQTSDDSAFHFSSLKLSSSTNTLNGKGNFAWDGGGTFSGTGTANINVGTGSAAGQATRLILQGGTYEIGAGAGTLTITTGGVLAGNGTVGSTSSTGTTHLNGGTIAPGSATAIGSIQTNGIVVDSSSLITLKILDFANYDQIGVGSGGINGTGALTLSFVLDSGADLQLGDSFQFFTETLGAGNIISSSLGVNYDFGSSASILAAEGLQWDTSDLATQGIVKVEALAVPEPTTWAMMAFGLGLLIWRVRRVRAA